MRLKCTFFLFIIFSTLFSQSNILNENKVDSILNESYEKYTELNFLESLKLSEKALELSLDINYDKGKTYSYLYIAIVLQDVGLKVETHNYIEKVENERYFKKDSFVQAETYRLKGRIASSENLYTLAQGYHLKQLEVASLIADPKKKELSLTMAYFYLQHLYIKQSKRIEAKVYHKLFEEHLSNTKYSNSTYYQSALYADRALYYIETGRLDEAVEQLDRSLQIEQNSNTPFLLYTLQIYGDLEMARGDTSKALIYYNKALKNSIDININHKTKDLHKKIADILMLNVLTLDEAKDHLREYNIINDSLTSHNKMLADLILSGIVKEKEEAISKKNLLFVHIVVGLILLSIILGVFLIIRNRIHKRNIINKNRQLVSTTEKIELLEEELESNIFEDIIDLAKSNSPEFLPLFEKGYPEFVAAMRNLNPSIRSSELYFCALAYLNFSTKDIANYTFVTDRAVQVRRNRMRKKYNIPSEIDFNDWFRSRTNGDMVDEN